MKRTPRLVALVVLTLSLAMVAGSAMAQPGGRGPGGRGPGGRGPGGMGGPGGMRGGGVMRLLQAEVVRTDLGITEETVEQLRNTIREAMQEGGDFRGFQGLRDLPEEERQAKMEELRKQMEERGKAMEKKIAEVLGPEKFGRLKEIELQMSGVGAIARSEVADYLGLTEEQKEKLQKMREESREASRARMEEVIPGGFGAMRDMSEEDRRAAFQKMRTMGEEAQKKLEKDVMGVLTDEQKKKLGEMMGKPFAKMEELQEEMRSGFGRGQGRRGDRGRPGDDQGRGQREGGRRQRPT